MNKLLAILAATTTLATPVLAQDAIKEFNIGILGGENAQDRITSNECYRAAIEAALGVPVKLYATEGEALVICLTAYVHELAERVR